MTNLQAEGNRFNQEGGRVLAELTKNSVQDLLLSNSALMAKDRVESSSRAKKIERKHQDELSRGLKDAEQKALGEADAMVVEEEFVAHPWHLHRYQHYRVGRDVIVETKDGSVVCEVAQYADNITGNTVVRTKRGDGHVRLPETWADQSLVRKACNLLVGEALGKNDLDLKFLIPRAVQSLKNFVPPWPGVEEDIRVYLLSKEFIQQVTIFHQQRSQISHDVLVAKLLREASVWKPTQRMCREAVKIYVDGKNYYNWYLRCFAFAFLWLPFFWPLWYVFVISIIPMVAMVYDERQKWQVNRLVTLLTENKVTVKYASIISILSSCSKGLALPDPLTCWKFVVEGGQQDRCCKLKQPYNVFGTHIQGSNLVIPNGCHHDQYNGLRIRYFFDRTFDKKVVDRVMATSMEFCRNLPIGLWRLYNYDEWVIHLTGKRGKMLLDTPECNDIKPQVPVDLFVKLEAYLGKSPEDFKPRIIQGRRLPYQNVVGPYFYSIGKWLSTVFDGRNGLYYDSGIDAVDLGSIALRMYSQKKYVFEIDVSNWDGSLVPDWLKFEMWFVDNCAPVLHDRWRELKRHWRTVSGVGAYGVKYHTNHGRRSGDMWTSCFNSLINLLILNHLFGDDLIAVAKGDDNFFGTNKEISVDEIVEFYAAIGMKAKVQLRENIDTLEYCSGKFWSIGDGYKWGLKPFRIIAKLGLNLHRHHPKTHFPLLLGTAISMLPVGGHVPFLGTLLRSIVYVGKLNDVEAVADDDSSYQYKNSSAQIHDIDPHSYAVAKHLYHLSDLDMCSMEIALLPNRSGHKLTPRDFPLVFDDYRFLRGFTVDCDCSVVKASNIHIVNSKVENNCDTSTSESWSSFPFVALVISPIFEEVLREWSPLVTSIILGTVESLSYDNITNLLFHLTLGALAMLSVPLSVRIVVHFLYNLRLYQLGRGRIEYASIMGQAGSMLSTLASKRAGLFSPIADCLALYKYRITACSQPVDDSWAFEFPPLNNKVNKKNPRIKKGGRTPAAPKKSAKARGGRRAPMGQRSVKVMADMLADPCDAVLEPGFYGTADGILGRYKSINNFTETTTACYVLWCPSTTANPTISNGNCFFYAPSAGNTTLQPVNTVANPLGTNTATATSSQVVGASAFLSSTTPEDFRTISACIRLTYVGTTSNCQGRIGSIESFPNSSLIDQRPTCDQLFGVAAKTMRVPTETVDFLWRPNEEAVDFRAKIGALTVGVAGTNLSTNNISFQTKQPKWFGFVIIGVPANQFNIEFIQNIEWRPRVASGYVQPISRIITPAADGYLHSALAFLDRNYPGWQTRAIDRVGMVASALGRLALGGYGQPRNRVTIMN